MLRPFDLYAYCDPHYPFDIFESNSYGDLNNMLRCMDRKVDNSFRTMRPLRHELAQRSGLSNVVNDANKFAVNVDVKHFAPEKLKVKIVGNCIEVNGKHEEKKDEHGWIEREFTRRYALPEECETDKVVSSLCNGMLTIEAPKRRMEQMDTSERHIPIAVNAANDENRNKACEKGCEKSGDKKSGDKSCNN